MPAQQQNKPPAVFAAEGLCAGERKLPVAIVVVFPMAMAICMATVMVVANAYTNRANMDADDCCIGSRGQEAKCKNRRDERFHGVNFRWGGPLRVRGGRRGLR